MKHLYLVALLLLIAGCSLHSDGSTSPPTGPSYPGDLLGGTATPTTPLVSPSSTYGGMNYSDWYAMLIADGLATNRSIVYTDGGVTYLTFPEYTSSSECDMNDLQNSTYLGGNRQANWTFYEVRSDMFSEGGILLSGGTNESAFDAWYNFLGKMASFSCYGSLPCWVVVRNGTTIQLPSGGNDTAIDGSVRSCIALYNAANNTAFSAGNRTKYRTAADTCAKDVYVYETISITTKATRSGFNVTRVPMCGGDCASGGLGSSVDQWVGYLGDVVRLFTTAWYVTGNTTYDSAARNFTAATHSVMLQNDSDGDGWAVVAHNFNYDVSGAYLGHTGGGSVNSYYYSPANAQWDYDDAARFYTMCDNLRIQSFTDAVDGPYANLSTLCLNWILRGGNDQDETIIQYKFNGTAAMAKTTGYLENGYGVYLMTYYNTSDLPTKLNEVLSHYNTGTNSWDSTSCGNAFAFRGSKGAKALQKAIGYDEFAFSGNATGGGGGGGGGAGNFTFNNASISTNGTGIGSVTRINLSVNTSNGNVSVVKAEILYPNGTRLNRTMTRVTTTTTSFGGGTFNWTTNDTDDFSVDSEGWSGGDGVVSGRYNKTNQWGTIRKNFGINSSTVYNISFQFWYDDFGSNDPKFFIGDDTGNDYLLFDDNKTDQSWKHVVDGGGYSTGDCGSETWTDGDNVTIVVNMSSGNWTTYHNNKLCYSVISAAITDPVGDFEIAQAESAIAIDNVVYRVFALGNQTPTNTTVNTTYYEYNNTNDQLGTYNWTTVYANSTANENGVYNVSGLSWTLSNAFNLTVSGWGVTWKLLDSKLNFTATVNSTPTAVDKVWMTLTFPNGSVQNVSLSNTSATAWYYESSNNQSGQYTVSAVYANNTAGQRINDTTGWSYTNTNGTVATYCNPVVAIKFKTNVTRGTITTTNNTWRYTETNIIPVNQSVAGCAFKVNNTLVTLNTTYAVWTNLTNSAIVLSANGYRINASQNYTFNVTNNSIALVNLSLNLTSIALNAVNVAFSVNVTQV